MWTDLVGELSSHGRVISIPRGRIVVTLVTGRRKSVAVKQLARAVGTVAMFPEIPGLIPSLNIVQSTGKTVAWMVSRIYMHEPDVVIADSFYRQAAEDKEVKLQYSLTAGSIDSIETQDHITVYTKERDAKSNGNGTTYIAVQCDTTSNTISVALDIEIIE